MTRITPTNKTYWHLVYAIWYILTYYSDLFGILPPPQPSQMFEHCRLGTDEYNARFIMVSIEKDQESESIYSCRKIKDIINEYIQFAFPVDFPEVKPFSLDGTVYSTVESLYLIKVDDTNTPDHYTFSFLYVDTPLAYKEVKADQYLGGEEA